MNLNNSMRVYHRYLGFFLAGIMAVYAISGIILIFRDTDFLKVEKKVEKELKPNLEAEELGKALRIRELQVTGTEGAIVSFAQGTYNKETGVAVYTTKELPLVLNKMTQLHKANTKQPLFFLNILFGLSLFFFVVSSFWMFLPGTDVFKKGLYFAAAGLAIALLLIFIK
ncbi:MAG: hypothetical protein ACOVMQ_02505 [Cyclobacteriaceae bacterium]|jgi:hypothetical protein